MINVDTIVPSILTNKSLALFFLESSITNEWQSRLSELQTRSLIGWRNQTIEIASAAIQDSIASISTLSASTIDWDWDSKFDFFFLY